MIHIYNLYLDLNGQYEIREQDQVILKLNTSYMSMARHEFNKFIIAERWLTRRGTALEYAEVDDGKES